MCLGESQPDSPMFKSPGKVYQLLREVSTWAGAEASKMLSRIRMLARAVMRVVTRSRIIREKLKWLQGGEINLDWEGGRLQVMRADEDARECTICGRCFVLVSCQISSF